MIARWKAEKGKAAKRKRCSCYSSIHSTVVQTFFYPYDGLKALTNKKHLKKFIGILYYSL